MISNDLSYDLNPKLSKSINYDYFEDFVKAAKKMELKDLFMPLHQFTELKKKKMFMKI